MSAIIVSINNGRMIGWSALEISAIPLAETLGDNLQDVLSSRDRLFSNLMRSTASMGTQQDVFVELLCIGQEVQGQVYAARPRLFIVFRKMGTGQADIISALNAIANSWKSSVSAFGYTAEDAAEDSLKQLLETIDSRSVISVEKQLRTAMIPGQMMYVGYSDELTRKEPSNFSALYNAVSRCPGSAVSIQLTATTITAAESQYTDTINYYLSANRSGRHCEGEQYYSRLQKLRDEPCYLGNILVFGSPADTSMISGVISGYLKGEDQSIAIVEHDRSQLAVPLSKGYAAWPWNYLMAVLSAKTSTQDSQLPLRRLMYIYSSAELRAFFHFPVADGKIQGIPINRTAVIHDTFAKGIINSGESIQLGHLVGSGGRKADISATLKHFTRHALVVGMPGTGKTTFAVNLLLQFYKQNPSIPFLAIEPTKTEYRAMIDAIPDLQVFTPGNNSVIPFVINPFLPPSDIPLEVFKPALLSAFKAAFSMPNPLDILFANAIDACYTQYGWRNYSKLGDSEAKPFGIQEFIQTFKSVIRASEYSNEIKGNMESAGVFRLKDLIVKGGNIYDTQNSVPLEDLLRKPTVIELNAIGDSEQKALIMALLLIQVVLYTKQNQAGDGKLKNIMLIDEAHVLLGNSSKQSSDEKASAGANTVKAIQDMIVEIRSYGTGIIIADQSPQKVTREVVSNTDVKVIFRLEDAADRDMLKNNTNMKIFDERNVAALDTGEAYVYFRGVKEPVFILTDDIREAENIRLSVSNDELVSRNDYWETRKELLKPYKECSMCNVCNECGMRLREDAKYYVDLCFTADKAKIKDETAVLAFAVSLAKRILTDAEDYQGIERVKLAFCCFIRYIRKAALETPYNVPSADVRKALRFFLKNYAAQYAEKNKTEKEKQ